LSKPSVSKDHNGNKRLSSLSCVILGMMFLIWCTSYTLIFVFIVLSCIGYVFTMLLLITEINLSIYLYVRRKDPDKKSIKINKGQ
jgi:hypothetical protein